MPGSFWVLNGRMVAALAVAQTTLSPFLLSALLTQWLGRTEPPGDAAVLLCIAIGDFMALIVNYRLVTGYDEETSEV